MPLEPIDNIDRSPIRHESLPPALRLRIKLVNRALYEVDPLPLQDMLANFQRDADPESEVSHMERLAVAFLEFCSGRVLSLRSHRRRGDGRSATRGTTSRRGSKKRVFGIAHHDIAHHPVTLLCVPRARSFLTSPELAMNRPLVILSLALLGLAASGQAATAQQSSIPDAIVGKAPPPSGTTVHYFPSDSLASGYLAVPKTPGQHPALILIHEWNGLVDRDRQVADAFASRGYVTLVSDLYEGKTGNNPQENVQLMNEAHAHPDQIIANLDAAQKFLRARTDVTGKVGVIGWCFGGGIALSYALGGAQHDATAIFYGQLVTDPARLATLHHPIYGTFAGQDRGIPADQIHQFQMALDSLGIKNDIHIYDPVQHGFWLWVDRDPATNLAPAQDAWKRLERFLMDALGAR